MNGDGSAEITTRNDICRESDLGCGVARRQCRQIRMEPLIQPTNARCCGADTGARRRRRDVPAKVAVAGARNERSSGRNSDGSNSSMIVREVP